MSEDERATLGKRARNEVSESASPGPAPPGDDDSDDEIGPMPVPEVVNGGGVRKKRRAVLPHERLYLEHLPDADRYYKSFMHRDTLNYVAMTKTGYLITTSIDGHLKIWKKQDSGIEFVKHFRTSLSSVVGLAVSDDGKMCATISANGEGRVFDIINFDMINILKFGFSPKAVCWVYAPGAAQALLAVSDEKSAAIRIYDGRGDGVTPLHVLDKMHRAPVHLMVLASKYDVVISADEAGFVEYWQPSEPWGGVPSIPGMWQYKSATDLFQFKKTRTIAASITLSPDQKHFSAVALPDRKVHIFNTLTGKLNRTYDESLEAASEMQQAGTAVFKLEDMDFGRRLAIERELDRDYSGPGGALRTANAVWDESGNMLIYATLLGIKVVNTVTNKVVRVIGKDESLRFLNLALFQGAPGKQIQTLAMAASANPLLQEKATRDPTLFCTALNKARFYMFGRGAVEESTDRDVYNERPTAEDHVVVAEQPAKKALPTAATIHTNMGDIHIKLFPHLAPKTVENFITHARNGYYNNVIFHRVIKKFMLQGGDPSGTGMGGESIWGGEFEDEISPLAKHDRAYTLSSANAGPNTNASQFFITTVATPHLDGKHTVFGRATGGLEVVHSIENVATDKNDRPLDEVRMVSITVE
ncbi:hypothetical protein CspeluHIS016_0206360 [Cutaneotrichosporon spelunceum]|uniref:peptidylprolyl isomerase n=1 Tax=Cutaneotrichosporon spelunceum TaxID=1672016 RepID=A0AAD3YA26_9TREE|nr:hypothetical protein CspeluHIS016_0206360 [Cutaneotrichosporon spelunceum]